MDVTRTDYTVRVLQWAHDPGPVGGVRQAVEDLTTRLTERGLLVERVDTASVRRALRMLPHLWERGALHIFHITRLERAIVMAPMLAALPGRTVVTLHSGSTGPQVAAQSQAWERVLQAALRAYDEIWTVNDEVAAALPSGLRSRVRVVSPFVPPASDRPTTGETDPHLITVATNSGRAHYGAQLAIEAIELARRTCPELCLWVLAYGEEEAAMATLRHQVAARDWVRLSFNLAPDEVAAALDSSALFLRPTSWDGDALIVRQALARGTRVLASDTAPRPAGTELSALDPQSFAHAVLDGGVRSDGRRLGSDTIVDAALRAMRIVKRGLQ